MTETGWNHTFHRHFGSDAIHRDGTDDCDQPGSPREVYYVFDPDHLHEHDRYVREKERERKVQVNVSEDLAPFLAANNRGVWDDAHASICEDATTGCRLHHNPYRDHADTHAADDARS